MGGVMKTRQLLATTGLPIFVATAGMAILLAVIEAPQWAAMFGIGLLLLGSIPGLIVVYSIHKRTTGQEEPGNT